MSKTIRPLDLLEASPTLITDSVPPTADIILRQAIISIAAAGGPQPEGDFGATAFQFIVTRTGNTAIAASVDWQVPSGIGFVADAPDFIGGVLPSGTVSFAAGETSKTITVLVATDNLIEADETFDVQLTARDVNVAIAQEAATATILNDDSYAELRIYAGGSTQPGSVVVHHEGNTGQVAYQFDIRRSGDLNRTTTANWQVAPSGAAPAAGNDFAGGVLPSGSVVFAAGETVKTITVQVAGDTRVESNETFDVVISTPNTDATVMKTAATGVILDNDKASELYIFSGESGGFSHTIVKNEGNTGTTQYTFRIDRAAQTDRVTTVDWYVAKSPGSTVTLSDFAGGVLPSGTVTFGVGQTQKFITVNVVGNKTVEQNEAFDVILSNPSADSVVLGATATGVILNDDQVSEIYVHPADPAQGSQFITLSEGDTGFTPFKFEISRTGDVGRVTVANWQVTPSGSSAANGADFLGGTLPSGTVAFNVGETSKIITVQVKGDTLVESNETFNFTVSTSSPDSVVMDGTATGVIFNDDRVSELYITSGESNDFSHFVDKNEGNSGTTPFTFRIDRGIDAGRVTTVDWYVTQTAGSTATLADFVGGVLPSGTVTFGVGETQKFISVNVVGDKTVEQTETFDVILANPSADSMVVTSTATGVIYNDDKVSEIYVHPADPAQGSQFITLSEGDTGFTPFKFEISRTGDVGRVTVANWQVTPSGSSAANGADFLGGTLPSGTVAFNVGETSKIITVQVKGDTLVESNETFNFTVSTVSPDSVVMDGTATGVIFNDDRVSELYISSGESPGFSHTIVKSEGNSGTTQYTFRIDRVMDTDRVTTVDWYAAKSPGSTVSLSDFFGGVLPSGTVTFGVGQTQKFITVNVAGDKTVEQNEAFDVILSNSSADSVVVGATATGMILNDDQVSTLRIIPGEPALLNYFIAKDEGNAGATQYTYAIHRGGELGRVTVADWHVTPTGIHPADAADFIGGLPSGSVTFGVGESTKLIAVNVRGDGTAEAADSFQVALSTASNDAVVTQATAGGIIRNDDQPGVVSISARDPHQLEGDTGITPFTFAVARTGDTTTQASVHWKVSGAASNGANAPDFAGNVLPSGTVTFAAGQSSQIVTLNVNGDTQYEADETFFVTLSNASPSLVIGTGSAAATIVNDDSARVAASVVSSDANSPTMSFIGGSDAAESSAFDALMAEDTSPMAGAFAEPTIADFLGDLASIFGTDIPEPSALAGLAAWTLSENPANFLLTHDLLV